MPKRDSPQQTGDALVTLEPVSAEDELAGKSEAPAHGPCQPNTPHLKSRLPTPVSAQAQGNFNLQLDAQSCFRILSHDVPG